jgi:hypothetical protein
MSCYKRRPCVTSRESAVDVGTKPLALISRYIWRYKSGRAH